jgi:hypothetical protein
MGCPLATSPGRGWAEMYAALWRALPGPRWFKVVEALVLLGLVLAFCFLWLFPRVSPFMPFSDNTVTPAAFISHPNSAI